MRFTRAISNVALVSVLCAAAACSGKSGQTTTAANSSSAPAAMPAASAGAMAVPTSRPTGAENNPTGDIPDTQKYVGYSATGVYRVEVPEGWARTINGNTASFTNKLDGVSVTLTAASAPPPLLLSSPPVKALLASVHAPFGANVRPVQVTKNLSGIVVSFASDSDTDPVTGKTHRLLNKAFVFYQKGHVVTLHLWAPYGSDNADPWEKITRSFQWL